MRTVPQRTLMARRMGRYGVAECGQSRRRRQPYDFIHPDGLHPWRGDEPAHGTEPVGSLFRSCKGSCVPLQSVGS